MKNTLKHCSALICAALATFGLATAHAQTTANWNGGAGTPDWNTALNWDIGLVPAEGTNAVIGGGNTVSYSAPMTATSFAGLNNGGTLGISAAGFNIEAAGLAGYTTAASGLLQVNAGGVVTINNSTNITIPANSGVDVEGGVLNITNSTGTFFIGASGNTGAFFTNNGGNVTFSQPLNFRGSASAFIMTGGTLNLAQTGTNGIFEVSNDQTKPFFIGGGTANLGNFSVSRTVNTPVGGAGLVISNNAVVNVTSLDIGTGASAAAVTVSGGILTNSGPFIIADRSNAATSGQRRIFFYVRGNGSVYSTSPSGIVLENQANVSATGGSSVWGAFLDISSGLISAQKLTLNNPAAVTNANSTLTLSGGSIYLGSGGLVGNLGFSNTSYTVTLSGGTLGALTDYSINANGTLSGTFTLKAADIANVPHNITHNFVWSGSGALAKTGNGSLILNSNNTYSGATTISAGTLALGPSGSISNTATITVASGATLDTSATAGFLVGGSHTLQGFGTVLGNVSAASTASISPGSNTVTGTLTLGSLTETGGSLNKFDLSTDPNGANNDLLVLTGDLNVSGVNTLQISGGGAAGSVYPLIQYGGNFNGTVANFSLSGASGSLSNNATTKTIYLVIESSVRPATGGVVWQGNPTVNDWDLIVHTNWVTNNVSTYFVSGDGAVFNDVGAANTNVNIPGIVDPASVLVDSTAHYTYSGIGSISGSTTSLTKTNSGTLTVLTTNSYGGSTLISGGALEASSIANGSIPSSIGASPSGAANLVLDGGTLNYLGGNVTSDRAATLNVNGGTIGVSNSASTLTLNGALSGAGQLTKTGPGVLVLGAANTFTNGSIISNGVLQFNNATGPGIGGVTNYGATVRFNSALTVSSPLSFIGDTKLEFSGVGSGNIALRGSWSGSGTVNVNFLTQNAGQTFSIGGEGADGGMMTNFFGTIRFGTNTGFVRINNNETINLGSSNIIFDLGSSNLLFSQRNGNTTTLLGGLAGGPLTKLSGSRSDEPGAETYQIGGANQSTEFDGQITNGTSGSSTVIIVKVGTGTLTLGGTNVYTGLTVVSNGVLALVGNGALVNSPDITVATNTVLDSSGRVDGTMTLNSGQTMRGAGTIRGSLTIGSGATLNVGDTDFIPGTLAITNNLVVQSGGTLNMDLDPNLQWGGPVNDAITGLNSVTYGGTLNLNVYGADANSVFKLFNANSYHGKFDFIQPAQPPVAGYMWDQSHLAIDGTLRLTLIRPVITSIDSSTLASGYITLNATGLPGGPVTVLSSTNLTTPLANWTTVVISSYDGNGNFSTQLTVDPTMPKQFFILQAQQ